jgi:HEPN domain-containing protein
VSSDAHAWLDIADTNVDAARRSLLPAPQPNIPAAAYHCQQAVES